MVINLFKAALLNLVPSGPILDVTIATERDSKSKNDLHWNETSCEKGFRMNPGITYFPVLVVEMFKVKIGKTVTKNFEKRSREPSQRT